MKEHSDSPEEKFDLLKEPWNPPADELAEIVPPKRLSAERQWYFHDQIRPFCSDEDKDTVCPLPSVPKPSSRRGTPVNTDPAAPPPSKCRRVCGFCKQEAGDHDHESRLLSFFHTLHCTCFYTLSTMLLCCLNFPSYFSPFAIVNGSMPITYNNHTSLKWYSKL